MGTQNLYEVEYYKLLDHEYDAQLFEFNIYDLITAILLLVNEEVTHFTAAMTSSLMKKYCPDDPEIELVKETTKKLAHMYMRATQKQLQILEGQLDRVLHIPSHVLLPGDVVHRIRHSPEDENEVDEQYEDLLKRILLNNLVDVEVRKELMFLQDAASIANKQTKQYECLVEKQAESIEVFKQVELGIISNIIDSTPQLIGIENDS